jgi:fucose permease
MIGLGLQIFTTESYILFLATVLLLGAGNAILQVAGNPIMRDVSAEGTYSRNLVVGQFVKAIGSLSTPLLTVLAASYFNMNWMDLVFPVLTLFIFLTVLNVFTLKVEEREDEKMELATFKSSFTLLKNKYVLMMVLGIFFYVGAEVCMSSGIANYMLERFDVDISKMGVASAGLFFVALLIGRLLGAFILNFLSPKVFFVITSLVSIVGMLLLFIAPSDIFGFIIVFIIGFGFANIFPLIFSITIDKMPERSNELSGLMVTAIVGGAIVPSLMGLVADSTTVMIGFIVPIICFVYIFITSLFNLKTK